MLGHAEVDDSIRIHSKPVDAVPQYAVVCLVALYQAAQVADLVNLRAQVGSLRQPIAGSTWSDATLVVGVVEPAVDERRLHVRAEAQERCLPLSLLPPFMHAVRHVVSLL